MTSTVKLPLTGELTTAKARLFIQQLKVITETEATVSIYFHSHGGCLRAYAEIANAMFLLSQKGVTFIGLGKELQSTALLIFLNCDKRYIIPSSEGIMYLPTPNTRNKYVNEKRWVQVRNDIALFIKRRTAIASTDQVYALDNVTLSPDEMSMLGIAKKIPSFDTVLKIEAEL